MTPATSEYSENVERLLTQHGFALPLLASGEGAEFVFFTHDTENKIRSLSDSSVTVCQIAPKNWLNQTFQSRLTAHPWNTRFHERSSSLSANRVYRSSCELLNDYGVPVRVDVWRRTILLDDVVIGVVGAAKRHTENGVEQSAANDLDPVNIRERIASMTKGERDVIDLVILGDLNKTIAAKLKIAMRTVEARRSKAMAKMGVTRLAELVRLWIAAELPPDSSPEPTDQ